MNHSIYTKDFNKLLGENVYLPLVTKYFNEDGRRVIFPLPTDIKGSLVFIKKLIEEGKFKGVIDRIYALSEIVDAYRYVETGKKTGNVVVVLR